MYVENMRSKSGNKVINQFTIIDDTRRMWFQSYSKIIAMKKNGRVYLDEQYWDYSKTTGLYRNMFLGETMAETRKKIKSGDYTLTDLNYGVRDDT